MLAKGGNTMSFVSRIREFFFSPKKIEKQQAIEVVADVATSVIGKGTSLSPYVNTCREILQKHNLKLNPHAFGTNVAGNLSDLSDALRECHQRLHQEGVARVSTNVTISSRTDKKQSIESRLAV